MSRDANRITQIFAAWLRDRAEQYSNGECCRCVFDELLAALQRGEPWEAYQHGELDDLLKNDKVVKAIAQPSLLKPAVTTKPHDPRIPLRPRMPKGFT